MAFTNLSLGPMRHHEAAKLARWAVDEGWNPGKADISIAWETDRDAFIALRKGDDLLGRNNILLRWTFWLHGPLHYPFRPTR